MEDMDFYVTLPSNASADIYPDNSIGCFRTKLQKPIQLNGPWEVGLIEMSYPKSWETLTERDCFFYIEDIVGGQKYEYEFDHGYYNSIDEVLRPLNNVLEEFKVKLSYDSVRNMVFTQSLDAIQITLPTRLSVILGVKLDDTGHGVIITSANTSYNSDLGTLRNRQYVSNPADIYGGFYNLYVYTDIINSQFVGDFSVPLLRTIQIAGQNQEVVTRIFDRPHYLRICKGTLTDVEIDIKCDQNRTVPFRFGKTLVKLHFRQVKHRL